MLAMQYSFTFPGDYDMGRVRERVRTKGPLTDGFPGLGFKAYLLADRSDGRYQAPENLYAPFYLWDGPGGMNGFLESPGFRGLTGSFGWPSVRTWSVWAARVPGAWPGAGWALRQTLPLAPFTDLAALKDQETGWLEASGALAAVTGFEPTTWTQVRFSLWPGDQGPPAPDRGQVYEVGHVSPRG